MMVLMCGIAGYLNAVDLGNQAEHEAVLREMAGALRHRGPDDEGVFVDLPLGLGLAHRRLSILDVSDAGHQPMRSASGRYTLVFNGEIYNHLQLREKLDSQRWRGHSDTETLLACVEQWGSDPEGLRACIEQWNGMFAIALWDHETRVLTMIRDRMGIKPLYYGVMGKTLLFASELKAMRRHPHMEMKLSSSALSNYLAYSYCSPEQSIYENCQQVKPGSFIQIKPGQSASQFHKEVYWDLDQVWSAQTESESFEAHCAVMHDKLKEAVTYRMLSDVPLGVFLSGGLDSSLVASLMQEESSSPIKTFTMGFEEDLYNEADRAAAIAQHLGTEHHQLILRSAEAQAMIPEIPQYWDEPFADSSQIPTYFLSRLTRDQVTVSLSGDGGDEVFGGYNRYLLAPAMWQKAKAYPYALRRLYIAMMRASPSWAYRLLFKIMPGLNPENRYGRSLESVIEKMAQLYLSQDGHELHQRLCAIWSPEQLKQLMPGQQFPMMRGSQRPDSDDHERGLVSMMMHGDMGAYLPNDILTKVDRASMAVGLETRVPLLDHHVVEAMATAPEAWKIRGGQGKLVIRELLKGYLPEDLLKSPKQGFAIPLAEWLRDPLREWADSLLKDSSCRSDSGLSYDAVDFAWTMHLKGQDQSARLWNILMLHAWLKQYQP